MKRKSATAAQITLIVRRLPWFCSVSHGGIRVVRPSAASYLGIPLIHPPLCQCCGSPAVRGWISICLALIYTSGGARVTHMFKEQLY